MKIRSRKSWRSPWCEAACRRHNSAISTSPMRSWQCLGSPALMASQMTARSQDLLSSACDLAVVTTDARMVREPASSCAFKPWRFLGLSFLQPG
jgi:hypothetical protein